METTVAPYTPTHLRRWKLPPCYSGARWLEYYVAPVTRNRDSELATNSNWDVQWKALSGLIQDTPDGEESSPRKVCENHWAVGWVEWVAIHESNAEALKAADALAEKLEDYPLLDDDDASNREWNAYLDEWGNQSTRNEFARMLQDVFGLCDASLYRLQDAPTEKLAEAFEGLIPSGDFFRPEGGGVSLNWRSAKHALERMDDPRAWMANLLRSL